MDYTYMIALYLYSTIYWFDGENETNQPGDGQDTYPLVMTNS